MALRPATVELALQLLRADLGDAVLRAMQNGITHYDVERALQHQLRLNAESLREHGDTPPAKPQQEPDVKARIAAWRATCVHRWQGTGPEGLGGYSSYQCVHCGQAAGVGGVLRD